MRLHRRLRERMVRWEESDVSMLPPCNTWYKQAVCCVSWSIHVSNSPC
jgi:hypothetical protein